MKQKYLSFLFGLLVLCGFHTELFAQYDKVYFFSLGRQNLIDGRYPQAVDNYTTLVKADSTLYDAYFYRGIAKYNLSDYMGALGDFNEALRQNPNFTQAYHYRAITNSQLSRFKEAMGDYDKALDLRPEYVGIYYSRGISFLMSQQLDSAIYDFNRFLRFEPKFSDAYVNRGTAHLLNKDTVQALADYNKAIHYNMFDPSAYVRRARVYSLQENNEKALVDLNEAIRLDSTNSFSYFNRALVLYNTKDINAALADLDKVLTLDPDNALTFYNRALIRSQIGDYNRALDDYKKVIEINPGNVLVYYNRAAVLSELGYYREAIQDYSKAIEIYPDFANAYMNRSYLKTQIGQLSSAKKDYETAQAKIEMYRSEISDSTSTMFADTTKQFNKLLALDADFTKKTFANNELQDRKMDIIRKPLFKFIVGAEQPDIPLAKQYFLPEFELFKKLMSPYNVGLANHDNKLELEELSHYDSIAESMIRNHPNYAMAYFLKAIVQAQLKQYSSSINYLNKAIELDAFNPFFHLNRSAIQAEMIDFVSAIENSMPKMTLDGAVNVLNPITTNETRANTRTYNYDEAIDDLNKVEKLDPDFAYTYYNRGNLKCLSNRMPDAIEDYTKAIKLYPYLREAYFNRGLVQIHLRDTGKGCLDISQAGELGMEEAYEVIRKYCLKEQE